MERSSRVPRPSVLSRRAFLATLALGAGAGLLAACSPSVPAASPPTPAPAAAAPTPAATAQPAAAPTAAPGAASPTTKLVFGLDVSPVGLDPATTTAFASVQVYQLMYSSLGTLEYATNKVLPDLAQSWRTVDPKTYEFTLRPGVKFHSGREVTAEDVKYSIERLFDPKVNAPLKSYLGPVDHVQVVDAHTARVVMKDAFAPLVSVLADTRPTAIVDRDVVEKHGDLKNADGGSGPFSLVEYTPDVRVVLQKNPAYHEQGKPYLDQIEFRIIPDESARLAAIRSGEVDMTILKDPKNAKLVSGDQNVHLFEVPSFWREATPFNVAHPQLKDPRVRLAISYATDRQEMINTVLLGEGVLTGPIPPGETEWAIPVTRENFPSYFPDLDKSRALLKEAGAEGLSISIEAAPAYAPDIPCAEVLQSQLKKVGITLEVKQMEWAAVLQAQRDGNFDLNVTFNTNRPDPDTYLSVADTKSSTNWGKYSNPKMDELLLKGRTTLDPAQRKQIYADVQRLFDTDPPYLFFYVIKNYVPAKPSVKGYVPMASGYQLALKETTLG